MKCLEHKIPPPFVGLALALVMWFLLTPFGLSEVSTLRKGLAIALGIAGLGLDAMGLLAFYRAKTTVNPLRPGRASSLVTTGVYRITRNPMYLGLALLLCGLAALIGSGPAFLGPLLFMAYITRFQIIPEERVMVAKFGDDYTSYCRQVRRWL